MLSTIIVKGEELKLVRGGKIYFGLRARAERAKIFPLLGMIFAPLWA